MHKIWKKKPTTQWSLMGKWYLYKDLTDVSLPFPWSFPVCVLSSTSFLMSLLLHLGLLHVFLLFWLHLFPPPGLWRSLPVTPHTPLQRSPRAVRCICGGSAADSPSCCHTSHTSAAQTTSSPASPHRLWCGGCFPWVSLCCCFDV